MPRLIVTIEIFPLLLLGNPRCFSSVASGFASNCLYSALLYSAVLLMIGIFPGEGLSVLSCLSSTLRIAPMAPNARRRSLRFPLLGASLNSRKHP